MRTSRQFWRSASIQTARLARRRFFVGDSEIAKGVRGVTGPVMLRPETDVAVLVLSLMVIAKGITTSFSRLLVEPATRKYSTCRFNPHHRRACTSVFDRISTLKTGFNPVIDVPLTGNVVVSHAVMRQADSPPTCRSLYFCAHTPCRCSGGAATLVLTEARSHQGKPLFGVSISRSRQSRNQVATRSERLATRLTGPSSRLESASLKSRFVKRTETRCVAVFPLPLFKWEE
jgi:hypothetical protein